MDGIGRAGKSPWTKEKAKKILLSWKTYLLREFSCYLNLGSQKNMINTNSGVSLPLYCLEQWYSPAKYGLLVEELQQRSSSSSRNVIHSAPNQQLYVSTAFS